MLILVASWDKNQCEIKCIESGKLWPSSVRKLLQTNKSLLYMPCKIQFLFLLFNPTLIINWTGDDDKRTKLSWHRKPNKTCVRDICPNSHQRQTNTHNNQQQPQVTNAYRCQLKQNDWTTKVWHQLERLAPGLTVTGVSLTHRIGLGLQYQQGFRKEYTLMVR